MKKPFYAILFAGLAMASCAKKRTCECTTSSSGTYNTTAGGMQTTNSTPATTTIEFKKVKKSDLKTICGDHDETSTATQSTSGSSSTSTYSQKCKIK